MDHRAGLVNLEKKKILSLLGLEVVGGLGGWSVDWWIGWLSGG